MDGRVDVMPLSKFHYNRTQQQETDGKGIFFLNESIFGEVQLGVKCN
jgi:hypothetical protein